MVCGKSRFFQILLITFLGLCQSITIANGINPSSTEDNIRCVEKERHALLTLKRGLVDNSGRLSSWGSEDAKKDCCLWRGVHCSNRTGHIIMLDLGNPLRLDSDAFEDNRLRGKIAPSLLELQHLRYLNLRRNDFGGTPFPKINGSLRNLRYLNLHDAGFNNKTLYQLGNLSKLLFLDFSWNFNTISNLDWVHSLSSLRYLNLTLNNLGDAKDWPQLLTKLPHLEELQLKLCSLPIILPPPSFTNCTSSQISIDLSENNLTSSMYPLFFNITGKIVDLNLGGNLLEGSISDFFRNMVSLKQLDLSHNQLGGEIPEFLGNICTLKTLDLSGNYFSRFVPSGLSGCIQNSLEILGLYRNGFPNLLILPYVTRFSSLRALYLSGNGLNGSFPASFIQPSKFTSLSLDHNQLTGPLPDLTKFSSLNYLDISYNRFNGTVPESLGRLSELKFLDASWNSLEGVISEAFFENLSKLYELDLSFNGLAFNVSSGWVPPFQLNSIFLSFCKLGPHFPNWLQTQKGLRDLDISGARISDTIPDWFWNLTPNLTFLNLSHNQMTGMLPDLSDKFLTFIGMDLSWNLFEGPLPVFPYRVTSLILAKNRFSGSVSPLCKITTGDLSIIDLSDNLLRGMLPDCFFRWQGLRILNLANNNFSGGIPTTVGLLLSVVTINLRDNSFSGDLPSSLKNCSELKFLDLSKNMFSGSIPGWIGENLSSLLFLSLQANKFNGSIPANLCQLENMRILDLSQNMLSGVIPFCLDKLTAMVQKGDPSYIMEYLYYASRQGNTFPVEPYYTDRAMVIWKGREYKHERNLGLLRVIDLSGNKLVGEIPDGITGLSELIVLNLSGNNLIGSIPKKIGHLKQLQSLDLSENQLSGRIPASIADLTFLSYLNLSHNNLSGKIPSGTQILTFDASAFVGNLALCGPPIEEQCSPPDDHGHTTEEDRDEFNKWFYVGMGIGFFIAFWGVFGSLLLKTSWRQAYFQLLDNWKDSLYATLVLWGGKIKEEV